MRLDSPVVKLEARVLSTPCKMGALSGLWNHPVTPHDEHHSRTQTGARLIRTAGPHNLREDLLRPSVGSGFVKEPMSSKDHDRPY